RHRSREHTLAYLEANPMTASARLSGDRRGLGTSTATPASSRSTNSSTRQIRSGITFQASSQPSPGTQSSDPCTTPSYPQSKRQRNE
ncbi:hypothetical protein IWQ62_005727, partial [Dispira parvispora]